MKFQPGNKFALGLTNNGRPAIYTDPNDLHNKCVEYFEYCIENKEKATITGLALFVGFSSRETLSDYKKKPDFSDLIKRACLTVENSYEKSGGTFDIFALKNMGWVDKQDIDHTTKGEAITSPVNNLSYEQLMQLKYGTTPHNPAD